MCKRGLNESEGDRMPLWFTKTRKFGSAVTFISVRCNRMSSNSKAGGVEKANSRGILAQS